MILGYQKLANVIEKEINFEFVMSKKYKEKADQNTLKKFFRFLLCTDEVHFTREKDPSAQSAKKDKKTKKMIITIKKYVWG